MTGKQLLIFDSGVGGLSIFQEVIKQSANVNCYYLSDNAYFPYGELGEKQLIERLTALLDEFVKQYPVDMIIIACNSASTVALQSLRAHFTIPVVGVVPAIKPASIASKRGVIGLVATPATIKRAYTKQLINQFAKDKTVLSIGSTLLVQLAEQKLQGKTPSEQCLQKVFKPWLTAETKPDTIVLGCTHFPLLKAEIGRLFDGQVKLVDSGEAIAHRVFMLLTVDESVEVPVCHVNYNAFYTLADNRQLALETAFLNKGFGSFSHFKY